MLTWNKKLPAGALQFTIFVSAIIALLLLAVVLLAYTHRYFLQQSASIVQNMQWAGEGMRYAKNLSASPDTLAVPLEEASKDQHLEVHLSRWGIYEKAFVKATHRKKRFVKCSLMGSGIPSMERPALYLQETSKPLMVVGTTRIEGPALLPQQGVRPGNISGNSYYGSRLVYGMVRESDTVLPKLHYNYKKELQYYLKEYEPGDAQSAIDIGYSNGKTLVQSFHEPVKGFYSPLAITLKDVSLYGNIIIRSDTKIIVQPTADLRDVILAAPVIEIQDGVQGNFQAIADTTIKVGKDCHLKYPSALVVTERDTPVPLTAANLHANKIHIERGSVIRGSVCYFMARSEVGYMTNIFVDASAKIMGEIYCQGNLELRGAVEGSVYTTQLVTNEGGTVFINHLYNASLTSERLPEAFGGIVMENRAKSVAKWLY